jgi:peptidoglycan hydrolase CwlO-like protein
MKFKITVAFTCLLLAGFTSSCREDPEDVKQHEQQSAELSRLRSRILIIEAQIRDMPADLSSELKEAEKKHELQKALIEGLKTEISEVTARIKSTQDEMKAYRVKYQIN